MSKYYSTNIPGAARLSGVTAKSVCNSQIKEAVPQHKRAIRLVYGGKVKSKRCDFSCFLKGATEMAKRTDSGILSLR